MAVGSPSHMTWSHDFVNGIHSSWFPLHHKTLAKQIDGGVNHGQGLYKPLVRMPIGGRIPRGSGAVHHARTRSEGSNVHTHHLSLWYDNTHNDTNQVNPESTHLDVDL